VTAPWPPGGPLYLSPPGPKDGRTFEFIDAGHIGAMTTPAQKNRLPGGVIAIGADTGLFGKGYPGDAAWFDWLRRTVDLYDALRFRWATAPDVPFDAAGTLARSLPWMERVRSIGVPVAFCAQNGCDRPGMIPWDELDVLFLGGGPRCPLCAYDGPGVKKSPRSLPRCPQCGRRAYEWKISAVAGELAAEAIDRGKAVHMGRVNSEKRMRIAAAFGCATIDGGFIVASPDENAHRMREWYAHLPARQPPHFQSPLFEYQERSA
jgi:hypothetical protein